VVVIENIYRFREEGYSRWEAARLGTAEVGPAVVASTATTVSAFAPMLFWPGIIGEFMGYMPLTLIITLTSSLFVALVINPVVTGFFVQVKGRSDEPSDPAERRWPAVARYGGAALILLFGIALGIANWETLVVIGTAIPVLYLLHVYVMSPSATASRRRACRASSRGTGDTCGGCWSGTIRFRTPTCATRARSAPWPAA
jgi:multidrug efflux pump subunit AcrB